MTPYENMPAASLAYLGDAVLELLARERSVAAGNSDGGSLNNYSRRFVTAVAQSDALESILPHLTEAENAVYHRGRNAHFAVPKSASVAQYRRATGLECVFGYLHLRGDKKRIDELFRIGFSACENVENDIN